jgi:hypothetical protein
MRNLIIALVIIVIGACILRSNNRQTTATSQSEAAPTASKEDEEVAAVVRQTDYNNELVAEIDEQLSHDKEVQRKADAVIRARIRQWLTPEETPVSTWNDNSPVQ